MGNPLFSCVRHDVVKGNGIVVPAGDARALAEAMTAVSRGDVKFDIAEGRRLAEKYSCEAWADRVMDIIAGVRQEGKGKKESGRR